MKSTADLIGLLAVACQVEAKEMAQDLYEEEQDTCGFGDYDSFDEYWNTHKKEIMKDYVDMLQLKDEVTFIAVQD